MQTELHLAHTLIDFIWKNKTPCRRHLFLHLHKALHHKGRCVHTYGLICAYIHSISYRLLPQSNFPTFCLISSKGDSTQVLDILRKYTWLNLHLCSWMLSDFILSPTPQVRHQQPGEGESEGRSQLSTASSWGKRTFQRQIWGLMSSASTFLLSWNPSKSCSLSSLTIHTKAAGLKSPLNWWFFSCLPCLCQIQRALHNPSTCTMKLQQFPKAENCSGGIVVNASSLHLPQKTSP